MTLLQIIPGSDQLVTGAANVTPTGTAVYGYLVMLLVVFLSAALLVIRFLYLRNEALHRDITSYAAEQVALLTGVKTELNNHRIAAAELTKAVIESHRMIEDHQESSNKNTLAILGKIGKIIRKDG